MQNYVLSH